MQPTNKPERTRAILKFLGLYLLSVIVIVFAFYFNTAAKKVEYDDLVAKNEELVQTVLDQEQLLGDLKNLNTALIATPGGTVDPFEADRILTSIYTKALANKEDNLYKELHKIYTSYKNHSTDYDKLSKETENLKAANKKLCQALLASGMIEASIYSQYCN